MGLIRVESETSVAVPPRQLFDCVTTPVVWHTWHPATVGERAVERIAVGRRRDEAQWVVRECQAPRAWQISTGTPNGEVRIATA
jgi:hypothetical protein